MRILGLIVFLSVILACQSDGPSQGPDQSATANPNALFTKLRPSDTHVDFQNTVVNGEFFNVLSYRNFYNGGGVAIGDVNNDGLADLFFTANMESNKLYINKGNWEFEDVSQSAGISGLRGWSTGVSMVDINADGFLDIYVSNSGDISGDNRSNELFINQGDMTFVDEAAAYNLDNEGYSTHASFFDYDLDGDLDCYILNNSFKDPKKISSFSKTREEDDLLGGDRLMRNDNGKFVDVSADAGIYTSAIGFGLGVSVSDINHDLLPDMYISNDFWERDYIYINQGDGTFSEELSERVSICSVSSMGADIGDVNNDGSPDIFTTDMLAADNYRLKSQTIFDPYFLKNMKYRSSYHYQILQNCLQLNRSDGSFQESASMSGVAATDWSWGALIFDFDNNGWNDIYVCNGIYHDIMDQDFINFIADKESVKSVVTKKGKYDFRDFLEYLPSTPIRNYAYVNQQNTTFKDRAIELGFNEKEFSNGAAYGDLDNDGDLDLVINNVNMTASLYRNNTDKNDQHYTKVQLKDTGSKNVDAIGATVIVHTDNRSYSKQHYMNRGFQSSVDAALIFGLGDYNHTIDIEVIWPDHTVQLSKGQPIDTLIIIQKSTSTKRKAISKKNNSAALLAVEEAILKGNSKHVEDDFNDFDREQLLIRMHSTEGPKLEVADVNGDGREDFVVLGATNDPDKLFIQNASGTFGLQTVADFITDQSFESTCAAFFDNDLDGDLDLLIGSGGNDFSIGIEGYHLRFYENDGKGSFVRKESLTPPAAGQFSSIRPHDFDKDGDIDLFISARSIPGNYGLMPRSFLLQKEQGRWTDITKQSLGELGMITDATWTDINQDGNTDLLVVGEWLPITYFLNQGTELGEPQVIANSEGWWLDINPADLDKDGDIDYVLGNWGLNTKFKASADHPISLYVKDFDKNGKSEFIVDWKPPADNDSYPFHTKMDLTTQLPVLKKRILKYADYAKMDYEELLTAEERKGAKKLTAHTLQSAVLRNNNGALELEDLPLAAQISPTFTSSVDDYNGDGYLDIWLGGNFYGLKPEVGRHNSSKGVLLLANSSHEYESTELNRTEVEGEVRDSKLIELTTGKHIMLIARNNMDMKVLSY